MKTTLVWLVFGTLLGMAYLGSAAPPVNDDFAQATLLIGNNVSSDSEAIDEATMEPGEPAHMVNVPQKSIWWEWQAPLWGNVYFIPHGSMATNVVVAVYTGDSVDTLSCHRDVPSLRVYADAGGQRGEFVRLFTCDWGTNVLHRWCSANQQHRGSLAD